jgi:hypothetical protein
MGENQLSAFVFLGPTLPVEDAEQYLAAEYLPPVAQGDVLRLVSRRPQAIGIIDGYFDSVPSVWHKEILFAMSRGIHLYGSASMGALRAAETAAFGMVGVGEIFDSLYDGKIEDDDEVVLAHLPAEFGYLPTSEAMVNIRATVAAAQTASVITPGVAEKLVAIAKSLYYPERQYDLICRIAASNGVAATELSKFRSWLLDGKVDQKRADAIAMLLRMQADLSRNPTPKQVSYKFEFTSEYAAMAARAAAKASYAASGCRQNEREVRNALGRPQLRSPFLK